MNQLADATAARSALRAEARARRDAMTVAMRAAASVAIANRAIAIAGAILPNVVAAYRAIRSEVDPEAIIAWAARHRIASALPATDSGATLVFRRYRPGDPLVPAGFGTLAPEAKAEEVDPDLVIVPLVAFDRAGTRLGYGRGFYDRGIHRLRARGGKPLTVGLAFAVQEVAAIPAEGHDVRMDWIVTEAATFDFHRVN